MLSTLWTEKICIQAQSKICHHTLILLLHYLAQTAGVYVTTKALRFYHIAFQQRVKKIITLGRNVKHTQLVSSTHVILSTALKKSLSSDCNYQSYGQKLQGSANYASPCSN